MSERVSITIDPMPPLRNAAIEKTNAWFNDRSRETLHDDLAALASGNPAPIQAREVHKQKVLSAIASCVTPEGLQTLMSDITKV